MPHTTLAKEVAIGESTRASCWQKPLTGPFRIGEWLVEPPRNRLTSLTEAGDARHLEPRLMHLLCFLAANSPAVLSRDQLTRELWPRVIVNDDSLTRAVSTLRKQLQGPARPDLGYIETYPKKGYRLSPPVERIEDTRQNYQTLTAASVDHVGLSPLRARHRSGVRSWAATAALPLLVAVVSLGAWPALQRPVLAPAPPATTLTRPATSPMDSSPPAAESSPVLSEAWTSLTALEPAGNAAAFPPTGSMALSPDGAVLALLRHEVDRSRIYLLRADGDGQPALVFSSDDLLTNLQWSPVGYGLLFARQPDEMVPTRLDGVDSRADLVMLDLQTLTLRTLIDNSRRAGESSAAV